MHLRWQISHAYGYLQLGMIEEAEAELAAVDPEHAEHPGVLGLKISIAQEKEDWEEMAKYSWRLLKKAKHNPTPWISMAFAMRRMESIEAAQSLLGRAEEKFPDEPTIIYNLGCYAALLGNRKEALTRVRKAIQMSQELAELAKTDEDLESVREELGLG